jgi:tetratricopeptide (TPR) repeat protein
MTWRSVVAERVIRLTRAIEQSPDVPGNYVFRGELYLALGEAQRAHDDFVQALALAASALRAERWGIIAQAMQDRALAGMEQAERQQAR